MTTLRDSVQLMFDRAGWQRITSNEGRPEPGELKERVDVYWFPTPTEADDAVEPVVVIWDRGTDWEPLQYIAGTWSRDTNHGDVLTSLRHAAERAA